MARPLSLQAGPGAERLGSEPLRELFGRVAVPCTQLPAAGAHLTRRRLMSVDGVELEVPDTPANAARVGYRSAKGGHGPFPQFLVMALAECGTRAVTAIMIRRPQRPWRAAPYG